MVTRNERQRIGDAVWESDLLPSDRLVMLNYLKWAGKGVDKVWVSTPTCAKETGLSERTVHAAHDRLIEKGWMVEVEAPRPRRTGRYRLQTPATIAGVVEPSPAGVAGELPQLRPPTPATIAVQPQQEPQPTTTTEVQPHPLTESEGSAAPAANEGQERNDEKDQVPGSAPSSPENDPVAHPLQQAEAAVLAAEVTITAEAEVVPDWFRSSPHCRRCSNVPARGSDVGLCADCERGYGRADRAAVAYADAPPPPDGGWNPRFWRKP